MKHLDLFSGIGGFALAASWVWGFEYENVGHSEVEEFPCRVYHKHFPGSPCLGDITKIEWREGQADIITGGFPCQPHSLAGKRKASGDERDLWGECVRTLRGVRPRHALFENVPGLLTSDNGRFFNRVLADLASIGYDAEWQSICASTVGAPTQRERVWIIAADPHQISEPQRLFNRDGEEGSIGGNNTQEWSKNREFIEMVASVHHGIRKDEEGLSESGLPLLVDGIPETLGQIGGFGNAIVPQVAAEIFKAIKATDEMIHSEPRKEYP